MIRRILDHIASWAEVYLWVPASLLGIFASAQLTYLLTGRRPVENADWMVEYSALAVKCVYIIALTSIAKQALGSWMTKDDKFEHPYVYTVNAIMTYATLVLFVYIYRG